MTLFPFQNSVRLFLVKYYYHYIASVVSDSVRPHGRQPTRLPRPWDSPGKNAGVGCHFLLQCMKVKSESEVAQSCPSLSDPMDCSLPGSSTHGMFQARVLEWVAIAFSATDSQLCLNYVFDQWTLRTHTHPSTEPGVEVVQTHRAQFLHRVIPERVTGQASYVIHTCDMYLVSPQRFHKGEDSMAFWEVFIDNQLEFPGTGEPGGLLSMGLHRVRHN